MRSRWPGCLLPLALAGLACRTGDPPPPAGEPAVGADSTATIPVVVEATVVAFWLAGSDTIPEPARSRVREQFARLAGAVERLLKSTDIGFVATGSDTVVIQLAGGRQRMFLLSGLDYPYGVVLVDPGYAEEFHTGLESIAHLEDAIAGYFGLEDDENPGGPRPRHRIAQSHPVQPGPRTARPGVAPVGRPSRTTNTPLTRTCRIPVEI